MTKMYAATTEYQEILPTTVRLTEEEAITAAEQLIGKPREELWKGGTCIAEFIVDFGYPIEVREATSALRRYVQGFRAKQQGTP